jgi:hypothetical protein
MRFLSLSAAALLAASPLLALASAATQPSLAHLPAPDAAVLKSADEAFQAAKRDCQMAGIADRALCLERARAAHAQTLEDAGVQTLPALQTQSAAVSATGIAATGVSERVHGAPEPQQDQANR